MIQESLLQISLKLIDFLMPPLTLGFGKKLVPLLDVLRLRSKPFTSCFLPLFQNESQCTTFHMEMTLICKTMNVQENLILF